MEKRTKHLTAKLFCLTLLSAAIVFYSCQSDLYELEAPETNRFGITDARNWFESAIHSMRPNEATVRSADGSPKVMTLMPLLDWNLAELSSNSEWEVVELPWRYERAAEIFALWEVWQHALANNSPPENITRLVVMQHRETGATYGFKMKIAPTLDYLLSHGGNLSNNKFLERDSRLSGVVLFYTLDGLFMNGWAYHDGETIAELVAKRGISAEEVNVPTTRAWWNDDPGFSFLLPEFVFAHMNTNGGGCPLSGWHNVHNTGPDWFAYTAVSSGGGGSGASPGQPNLNPPQQVQPPRPAPERILRRPAGMTDAEWSIIERLFRDVDNNCVGRALVNTMMGLLDGTGRIEVRFDDAGHNRFSVQGGIIFLRTDVRADTFFHELFHSRQAFQETLETWGTVDNNHLLNLEMEARYAQYLFLRQTSWFAGSAVERAWRNDPSRESIMELTNYLSNQGNLLPGAAADLNTHITNRIMPALGAVRGHEQLRFDPSRVGIVNFNRIRGLTINCP